MLSQYSDYIEQQPSCYDCDQKDYKIYEAGEYLKGVIEQIYGNKNLDTGILEHCLDELCYFFDVKPIQNELGPKVSRKL